MEADVRTLTCLGMGREVEVEAGERACAGERHGPGVGEIVSSHSALSLWFLTHMFLPLF